MPLTIATWEELLSRFPRAAPELLDQRRFERRTDSKFVLPVAAAAELLSALIDDYAVVAAGSSLVATYRTLYFDTDDLELFHAHLYGRRLRHKIRIRHYPDRRVSFLEVKTRSSELETSKARTPRAYDDNSLGAEDLARVKARTGIAADPLPQVWTDFRRVTLVGVHTAERVTFDLDVVARMGDKSQLFGEVVIVEVKQFPLDRSTPVMIALQNAGYPPGWASKYCAAIAFMRPDVRPNRLLPELRVLKGVAA